MDMKVLEARALAATLDNFAVGVIVLAEGHCILHANDAAREMFAAGGPVWSVNGRLSVRRSDASCELAKAIALAQQNEATIGAAGIGVALGDVAEPAVAHVLPLARGELRSRRRSRAFPDGMGLGHCRVHPQATTEGHQFVGHMRQARQAGISLYGVHLSPVPRS